MTEDTKFDHEKASFFSIVCYGIHSKLNSWIKNEFEKCIGQKPISFYEYFLTTPITKEQARKKRVSGELQAYSPFLYRILNEREWIPEMGSMRQDKGGRADEDEWKKIDMVNSSFKTLKEFWTPDGKGIAMADVKDMPIMNELVKEWGKKNTNHIPIYDKPISRKRLVVLMNDALEGARENLEKWLPFVQEYSLVVLPWLRCQKRNNFSKKLELFLLDGVPLPLSIPCNTDRRQESNPVVVYSLQ